MEWTGFPLCRALQQAGYECHVLPPAAERAAGGRKKADRWDAADIAVCLPDHTHSDVYVPTEDEETAQKLAYMREFLEGMLDDSKQRDLDFCQRRKLVFKGTGLYWTNEHLDWARTVEISERPREMLNGYLQKFGHLQEATRE